VPSGVLASDLAAWELGRPNRQRGDDCCALATLFYVGIAEQLSPDCMLYRHCHTCTVTMRCRANNTTPWFNAGCCAAGSLVAAVQEQLRGGSSARLPTLARRIMHGLKSWTRRRLRTERRIRHYGGVRLLPATATHKDCGRHTGMQLTASNETGAHPADRCKQTNELSWVGRSEHAFISRRFLSQPDRIGEQSKVQDITWWLPNKSTIILHHIICSVSNLLRCR